MSVLVVMPKMWWDAILDRLSQYDTLADVAQCTFTNETDDDAVRADVFERVYDAAETLYHRVQSRRGEMVEIKTPIEAWVLADSVEGTTWPDAAESEAWRTRKWNIVARIKDALNAHDGYIALLGRRMDVLEETPAMHRLMRGE